jgi:ribosomal protein L21E
MNKKQAKIGKVMGEYKEGTLHSGKSGKVVKNKDQALAIAISSTAKNARFKK